jgi:hypothetical protein
MGNPMAAGRRWTVRDRYQNDIYLTQERWEHIIDPINHPEMSAYEEQLQDTIRSGQRRRHCSTVLWKLSNSLIHKELPRTARLSEVFDIQRLTGFPVVFHSSLGQCPATRPLEFTKVSLF